MPNRTLPSLQTLKTDYPKINFSPGETFYWSARNKTVYYIEDLLSEPDGLYQLLHELGHALSDHKDFESGISLLRIEADAWAKAEEVAKNYNVTISQKHIEACLDSYRDWLYLRSNCPSCSTAGVETGENTYRCFNCLTRWTVPADQRRRCYRLKSTSILQPKLKTPVTS